MKNYFQIKSVESPCWVYFSCNLLNNVQKNIMFTKILRSHITQNLYNQCFVTIICVSSLSHSPGRIKVKYFPIYLPRIPESVCKKH